MLKNIKLLEKLNLPIESLQDNSDFQKNLKILAPFFDFDFATATNAEKKIFYYNLMYVAQRDLSMAHCVQHNHKSRLAVSLVPDRAGDRLLKSCAYHETICCYSSSRAADTIRYDTDTNMLLPGTKCWVSNLKSADICVIEVPKTGAPQVSYAHKHSQHNAEVSIYVVYLNLNKIKHSRTDGTESPTAVGMKGAAPGILTLHEPLPVGTDDCYILKTNPRSDPTYPWGNFVRQCWVTVHLGVIIGLYDELSKCPEVQDPVLVYKLKSILLEISALKIMWESGLDQLSSDNVKEHNDINPVMPTTSVYQIQDSGYALSKKVLLDLIRFTLEIGLNQFVDDTTPQWLRVRDAITYSTHMLSFYRCNKKYDTGNYNLFNR